MKISDSKGDSSIWNFNFLLCVCTHRWEAICGSWFSHTMGIGLRLLGLVVGALNLLRYFTSPNVKFCWNYYSSHFLISIALNLFCQRCAPTNLISMNLSRVYNVYAFNATDRRQSHSGDTPVGIQEHLTEEGRPVLNVGIPIKWGEVPERRKRSKKIGESKLCVSRHLSLLPE